MPCGGSLELFSGREAHVTRTSDRSGRSGGPVTCVHLGSGPYVCAWAAAQLQVWCVGPARSIRFANLVCTVQCLAEPYFSLPINAAAFVHLLIHRNVMPSKARGDHERARLQLVD